MKRKITEHLLSGCKSYLHQSFQIRIFWQLFLVALLAVSSSTAYSSIKGLEADGDNLITNGEFDDGTTGWTSVFQGGAEGGGSIEVVSDAGMSGDNAGKINIENGGSADWNIELYSLFNMEIGKSYEITFKAKAATNRPVLVIFQKGSDPYSHYWERTVNLTTETQDFGPFTWTATLSDPETRLNFKVGGNDADIWIDAVVIKEVEPVDNTGENLISNHEFNEETAGWRSIFHSPAAGSFEIDHEADLSGPNAGKITIVEGGANWQIELFTVLSLEEGKVYDVSFRAKAAETRTALVTFQRGSDPFNNYWEHTVNLTTTTQLYGPFRWISNITDEAARLNFRAGGSNADVWLDEIIVKEVILTGDTEAPSSPTNLTTSNVTETSFTLSWDASTDNVGVALYEVFAGVQSKGTTTSTSMNLTGMNCGTDFSLTVVAKDTEGNVSAPSSSLSATTSACSTPAEPKNAHLGMNLSSPRSWNSEFFFTNLAHHSLAWMPLENEPNFGVRIPVTELTEDRYLQPGATGRLTIMWDLNPTFISTGEYVFTYEGTADVALSSFSSNSISEVSNEPGRIVVNIAEASSNRFLYFDVSGNSESDPIRNIRFTEIEREHSTDIFRPEFVNDYSSLKAFRFMDWGNVNNSTVSNWEEYPADNALIQTGGVSYNYMIALANQTKMDAWFTVPVLADDDYLRQMAAKIRDGLNPELRAYIELSNEVWNGGFAATGQAAEKGRELGLSDYQNNKQDAGVFYGYRTAQMENIFKDEFAKASVKPSITTVVSWQSVDTWSFENMVIPGYRMVQGNTAAPEAVAIAPYFGGSLGSAANEAEVVTWTADMVLDQLLFNTYGSRITGNSTTVTQSFNSMQAYKALVDKYGISEYLAYEGGQHMVASNNNQALVSLLAEANRNRKMFDAYIAYFDAWRDLGGDLFATFASTASYGRSGSWGWKERPWHTREEAPKYDAILTWNSNNKPADGEKYPLIERLTLLNAESNIEVYQLEDNHVVNLKELGTKEINIRAVSNPAVTGSVKFSMKGALDYDHIENVEPYALFKNDGDNYFSWQPVIGEYELTVTPYKEKNGAGDAGTPLTISFTVIDGEEAASVLMVALINAQNNQELFEIEDGQVIDLQEINTEELNIRAYTEPTETGSVKFILSGTEEYTHIENVEPYALFKNDGDDFFSWTPEPGDYELDIIPYANANGKGKEGSLKKISFSIINSSDEESMRKLQVYPNPGSEVLFISSKEKSAEKLKIRIFDMKGNEIIKGKNKMNVQTDGLSIDVSDLKKQYYIIHIIGENGIEKFRWLKE